MTLTSTTLDRKIIVQAETIKALRKAADHLEKRGSMGSLWIRWLREVSDAVYLEYLFRPEIFLARKEILANLDGLEKVTSDAELIQWCIKTSWNNHALYVNVRTLGDVREVKEFKDKHSERGLLKIKI